MSLSAVGCARGGDASVMVFAAASLTDVMQAHAAQYLTRFGLPADHLRFHFQSSTVCAAQIRQGAPADLFVSADDRLVQMGAAQGLFDRQRYHRLVRNTLVLVVPRDHPSPIRKIADLGAGGWRRIALGDPETVPAGRYASAALSTLGLWDHVRPHVLKAEHVRQALLYVATGEAEAGLVYASDAMAQEKVLVVDRITGDAAPEILYSGVLVASSHRRASAARFLLYLASDEAASTWRLFGFEPLAGGGQNSGTRSG